MQRKLLTQLRAAGPSNHTDHLSLLQSAGDIGEQLSCQKENTLFRGLNRFHGSGGRGSENVLSFDHVCNIHTFLSNTLKV